jgi:hypothetical protein
MDEAQTDAVTPRKAPATLMKEKIDEQAAEIARLKALVEAAPRPAAPEPIPSRARENTERRERQRRGSNDLSHQMKLGVGFKPDPNYEYRWINGGLDDQRLHDKTRTDRQGADWQPLTSDGTEASDSTGTVLRRAVGTNQAGQVEYSYLCRKPKDLFEEDHGEIQSLNDKRMQAIFEGRGAAPGEQAPDGLGYEQRTEMTGEGRKAIKL